MRPDEQEPGRRSLENVTHVDLLDLVGFQAGTLDSSLDGYNTELGSGSLLEHTIERSDGSSGGGKDENVVDLRLFGPSLEQKVREVRKLSRHHVG